jgi:hypothetical protein
MSQPYNRWKRPCARNVALEKEIGGNLKTRYFILLAGAGIVAAAGLVLNGPHNGDPAAANAMLSSADLKADFDLVYGLIRSGVPTYGLFEKATALDAKFAAVRSHLDKPMSPLAFWRLLGPAVTAVGDGHLSLSPSLNTLTAPPYDRLFPLSVRFAGDRLIVRRNLSDADIPAGSEVISINGFTPIQIVDSCGSYVSHSPEIRTRLRERIPRVFSEVCTRALEIAAPYAVTYATPGGVSSTVTLESISAKDFDHVFDRKFPSEPRQLPLALDVQSTKQLAVLTLRTFEDSDTFNFAKEVDAAFATIRANNVQRLVLDLRQNGGGPSEAGLLLFSHIAREPFRYVLARHLSAGFRDVIWNSTDRLLILMELAIAKQPEPNGGFRLTEAIDAIQRPRPDAFTGDLYVLIDGASFSTASNVATLVKHYRRGRLVGTESGTSYSNDSGATFDVVLPRSGLRAVIPVVWYRQPGGGENPTQRGVLPDVPIERTADDIVGNTDSAMVAALALAANR